MHRLYFSGLLVLLCVTACLLWGSNVGAVSQTIVISEVQVRNGASASNELIELYNNGTTPVDVTGWCLYYASASLQTNGSKLACLTSSGPAVHIFLPAHAYALALSTQFAVANPNLGSDVTFSATLSDTAGHVRLLNAQNTEIDKVGWGQTAVAAEGGAPAAVPTSATLLQRKLLSISTYQDTDNNNADFQLTAPRTTYAYGALYDVQDLCVNITGIQETIPTGMDADASGNCYEHDECTNLPGAQAALPDHFAHSSDDACVFAGLPLSITELLANPTGDDTGSEFVEVYNPNAFEVDLSYFTIKVGQSLERTYSFVSGATIAAGTYHAFYNDAISFTLINTSSRVGLALVDGTVMDQTDLYTNPVDGSAWAFINGIWQYTDQPTPGAENILSQVADSVSSGTTLQPCASNQYRSPETNRCRTTALLSSTLTPCKEGQYRSEETNRCRSLASATAALLKPCNDDQFRNPSTGRCKKIASAEELAAADCGEGRERNPTTKRCRNSAVTSVPEAAFAVEPVKDGSKAFVGWWALGGVGSLAVGYSAWEWRREVVQAVRRVSAFFSSKK